MTAQLKSKINRAAEKELNKKYHRVKCNCGEYMKDHFENRGWCSKNGCTWYWPNDRYLLKQRKLAQSSTSSTPTSEGSRAKTSDCSGKLSQSNSSSREKKVSEPTV